MADASKTSDDSTERYYAEMEAARNTAMDAYFIARPQLLRTPAEESIFRAGFERAFSMLWNGTMPASETTVSPVPQCTCRAPQYTEYSATIYLPDPKCPAHGGVKHLMFAGERRPEKANGEQS